MQITRSMLTCMTVQNSRTSSFHDWGNDVGLDNQRLLFYFLVIYYIIIIIIYQQVVFVFECQLVSQLVMEFHTLWFSLGFASYIYMNVAMRGDSQLKEINISYFYLPFIYPSRVSATTACPDSICLTSCLFAFCLQQVLPSKAQIFTQVLCY